jgi:hypothetical protein
MQSGLADMDVDAYEDWVLLNESVRRPREPHDPLEDLKFVAGLNQGPAGQVQFTKRNYYFPSCFSREALPEHATASCEDFR